MTHMPCGLHCSTEQSTWPQDLLARFALLHLCVSGVEDTTDPEILEAWVNSASEITAVDQSKSSVNLFHVMGFSVERLTCCKLTQCHVFI